MSKDARLIWVDMEMTGLNPDTDRVIEIATIVTSQELEILAEGPVIAVHQSENALLAMDEWNTHTHTRSGLVERVRASSHTEATATQATLAFLEEWVTPNSSPMCGNSICQDRRFWLDISRTLRRFFIIAIWTLRHLSSWPPIGDPIYRPHRSAMFTRR